MRYPSGRLAQLNIDQYGFIAVARYPSVSGDQTRLIDEPDHIETIQYNGQSAIGICKAEKGFVTSWYV